MQASNPAPRRHTTVPRNKRRACVISSPCKVTTASTLPFCQTSAHIAHRLVSRAAVRRFLLVNREEDLCVCRKVAHLKEAEVGHRRGSFV
jgi:hypothetical protein